MRVPTLVGPLAVGALVVACSTTPKPVPVIGAAGDIAALAGRWAGEYSSDVTGRSGGISFTLTPTSDSAFGDVVMIPRGLGRPLARWSARAAPGTPPPHAEVLTINFVHVAGGRVAGTLAPYADPETGAELFTTFDGEMKGDTIAGTYSTRTAGGSGAQTGRWQVTRQRS